MDDATFLLIMQPQQVDVPPLVGVAVIALAILVAYLLGRR